MDAEKRATSSPSAQRRGSKLRRLAAETQRGVPGEGVRRALWLVNHLSNDSLRKKC